jgi:uncharacterized membrane protein
LAPTQIDKDKTAFWTFLDFAQESPYRRYSDLLFGTAVGLTVLVAVWLRCSGLDSQSLWADEGYTVWISQFSPKEIWHILEADTGPPLYYFLVHYWSGFFGNSEASVRALSAFLGILSMPLFYLIGRKILSSRMAVALATALYSVSFCQIWYAKDARSYALLVLLSLGTIYLALRNLERPHVFHLLGLGLVVSASLYTHNIALFYLPGLAVLWFTYPSVRTLGERVRDGVIVGAVALLSYLPWLPSLDAQRRLVNGGFWVHKPRVQDLLETLCILSGFDTFTFQYLFRDHFHVQQLFGCWTWAPVLLIVFGLCAIGGLYAVQPVNRRKSLALLAYSVLPILLVFLDSRVSTPIYMNRAFTGACVLLPLVFCAPIAFQTGNRQQLFRFIALVALAAAVISSFGYLRRERKEDWRGAAEYLLKVPERARLVLVVPDYCQSLIHYYATGLFKSYPPVKITGLATTFIPLDPDFEISYERTVSPIELLSKAMDSGRYKEIDFALRPSARLSRDAKDYMRAHCGSVEMVEFQGLQAGRCFVQAK